MSGKGWNHNGFRVIIICWWKNCNRLIHHISSVNMIQLDVMWEQVMCHCSLVLTHKVQIDVASYISTSSILHPLKKHIKIHFALGLFILLWIKRTWHLLHIEIFKFLAHRVNTESNTGIQIIWIERELILLFFFPGESDAGEKLISN